jgi:hypothetical protein
VTWPAISPGQSSIQNLTVPNAPVGTSVYVAMNPAIPANDQVTAVVTSTGTIAVTVYNASLTTLNLGTTSIQVQAREW